MVTYILEHLTDHDVDLQACDVSGFDLLMLCAKLGDVIIFSQLVAAGCQVHHHKDSEGDGSEF